MTTKGRQDAIARRVWERFRRRWVMSLDRSRDQLGIITYHLLEDLLEKVEEIQESLSVLPKMGAYSERIVAQKLQDEDFKQDLEAARGRVLEARGGDENTFNEFAPLITWNLSDARWDLVADADDSRAYVRAVREAIADLCAKYSLNEGWRLWLYHYLESGPGNGGVKLYSVKPVTDRFGGRYVEAKYYFPLSRGMLKEIAFEIEFTEVDAFGEYYGQISAGGRPLGPSEATRQEWSELAADYGETQKEYRDKGERPLTQREFCEDRGISVSKLQRALRWACESKRSPK